MLNIIGHKNIFLSAAAIFVGAAVFVIISFGLKQGIDFKGGTLWTFSISVNQPSIEDIGNVFRTDLGLADVRITFNTSNNNFLVRLPAESEVEHQKFGAVLKNKFGAFNELSFQSIGPSVGRELRNKSFIAIGLVLLGISLYIAFAFRKVTKPVSSWKYGWITLISLFHDVAIPAGLLAVLGRFANVEIDGNFVVALLVVMGFSVHDTIVVFDRIRENLVLDRGKTEFGTLINQSVNQTLARSINTSLTLILVLLALYFVGPLTLRYFILTLLIGVTTGIYSSIFVASPLLLIFHRQPTSIRK